MSQLKEGDVVYIDCEDYKGSATIVYIDWSNLYNHQNLPIQVSLDPDELHQFEDNNNNQLIRRYSMKDIFGDKSEEVTSPAIVEEVIDDDEEQLSLF